ARRRRRGVVLDGGSHRPARRHGRRCVRRPRAHREPSRRVRRADGPPPLDRPRTSDRVATRAPPRPVAGPPGAALRTGTPCAPRLALRRPAPAPPRTSATSPALPYTGALADVASRP